MATSTDFSKIAEKTLWLLAIYDPRVADANRSLNWIFNWTVLYFSFPTFGRPGIQGYG